MDEACRHADLAIGPGLAVPLDDVHYLISASPTFRDR